MNINSENGLEMATEFVELSQMNQQESMEFNETNSESDKDIQLNKSLDEDGQPPEVEMTAL